jgi:amino-acid N-acetyltransferase
VDGYARWFRDSTPYISAHRNKTFVVQLGGDALDSDNLINIVHDLALLQVLGVRLVVVHGARGQIDAALPDTGFHANRRVTDHEAIRVIAGINGQLRTMLEAQLSMGLPASPMHNTDITVVSGNFVSAMPLGVIDGVDHLFTGKTRRVHADRIEACLDMDALVLLSPIGYSPSGEAYNLAADELAADVAIALGADKLIMFDAQGKVTDQDGQQRSELTPRELDTLLDHAKLTSTTASRLRHMLRATRAGLARCHLISFCDDGALLEELFTAPGCGTQLSDGVFTGVRPASVDDVAGIVELIRPLEDAGQLVRRSRDRLEIEIDRFIVAEIDGIVIGCCAVYPFENAMELGCVAVHDAHRRAGNSTNVGSALLAAAEAAARGSGVERLFALTTQARDWFLDNGFVEGRVEDLPTPKQQLYNYQRNSKVMTKNVGNAT